LPLIITAWIASLAIWKNNNKAAPGKSDGIFKECFVVDNIKYINYNGDLKLT